MLPEYLSASRIKTWLMCPEKYRLQYVERIPWEVYPTAMLLGSAIHGALETFYREWQEGRLIPLSELHEVFMQDWELETEDRRLDTHDPDAVTQQGRELLTVFYDMVQPGNIVAVEDEFRVPIVDPETGIILPIDLVGRYDLLEADEQGRIVIVDHKVVSRRPSDIDMEFNLQLWAYGYAARARGDIPADENALLRIDALLKLKTVAFDQRFTIRTPDADRQFFQLASGILHAIDTESFPRIPAGSAPPVPTREFAVFRTH